MERTDRGQAAGRGGRRLLTGALLALGALTAACGFEAPAPLETLATPAPASGPAALVVTPAPTRPPTVTTAPARPTPSPSPTPDANLVVELDEATLTDRLNQQLAGRWQVQTAAGPATVEQLTGRLQAGRLSIDGTARAGYLVQLPLRATTAVSVQDRSPRVQVEQATVGGILVPEAGRLEIERTLQGALDQALAEEGVEVHSLEIEQGKLIAR